MSWGRQLQRAQDAGYQSLWFDDELDGRFRVVIDDWSTVRPSFHTRRAGHGPLAVPLGIDVELDDPDLVTGPRLRVRCTAAHEEDGTVGAEDEKRAGPRAYARVLQGRLPVSDLHVANLRQLAQRRKELQVAAVLKCIGNLLEVDILHQLIDMNRDGSANGALTGTITIHVDELMQDVDFKQVADALQYRGYLQFLPALRKLPEIGYVQIGDRKTALRYAAYARGPARFSSSAPTVQSSSWAAVHPTQSRRPVTRSGLSNWTSMPKGTAKGPWQARRV